ncbi:MAG: amidase [Hyphomicrobiales bacterium]|nr:amidase [Hyphomicrobiales bacterium]
MNITNDRFNAFLDLSEVSVFHAQSGPLTGLTLAVKDIFDVAGYPTGCGNPQKQAEAVPAAATAPAVQKLLDAGARFVGKTQTEELAFSMLGQNVHFPHPVNPAAPGRVTGGSSSGSAAAVAGGLADIATGSDTGGSIRAPASFCGLVGLRTTHGAISLKGTMPLAPSFDTFGWFARDIEIYEKVGEVLLLGGGGTLDRPLRIEALDTLLMGPEEVAEYARLASLVADVLGRAREIAAPPQSIDALYWATRKLQAREAWDAHGAWIEQPGRKLGEAVFQRFLFGKSISDEDVKRESEIRAAFTAWLRDLLADDGILVMPTVPCPAPGSDAGSQVFSDFREQAIRLLCWSGLSGFPQITLPLGTVADVPFGISLLGPAGSDLALIATGKAIMQNAGNT